MSKRFKVALALGGGGVRGLAHIGILKAFEQANISLDLIVGTSMGSIVGGAYALCGQSSSLEEKLLELLKKEQVVKLESLAGESRPEEKKKLIEGLVSFVKELLLWNLKGIKRWIVDSGEIKALIRELVKDADFTQTKVPFSCCACDLKTGEEVILDKGRLIDAIIASSSMPGVFAPAQLMGRVLVDGGITSEVPVEAARKLGADFVIAVNVESRIFYDRFRHGMDILFQSDEIRSHELVRLKLEQADFIITPQVEDISWAAFSKGQECIRRGEEAARAVCELLNSTIARKRRTHIFKRFFSKPKI